MKKNKTRLLIWIAAPLLGMALISYSSLEARTFVNPNTLGNPTAEPLQQGKITAVDLANSRVSVNGQIYYFESHLVKNEKTGVTHFDKLIPGNKVIFAVSEQRVQGLQKLVSIEFLSSAP